MDRRPKPGSTFNIELVSETDSGRLWHIQSVNVTVYEAWEEERFYAWVGGPADREQATVIGPCVSLDRAVVTAWDEHQRTL